MTTIVVEDGTIVSGANSYVSEADLTTYASDRDITLTADEDVLLIKAMDYIESLEYKGCKYTATQPLQWPRINVYIDGWLSDLTPLPVQLINGLCEVAIAIDEGSSPLEDIDPQVKREKVGDLEVEYMAGSSPNILNTRIPASLWKLLSGGTGGQFKVYKA